MLSNFLKGFVVILAFVFVSGCATRTYVQEKGRVDQEMTGNGGCIQGTCPPVDRSNLPKTRDTYVLEIDAGPSKVEAAKSETKNSSYDEENSYSDESSASASHRNYGNVNESSAPEVSEPSFTEYKIEKGDTLQKISQKFYGTVKRWNEIYKANKDVIPDPNRIKPGKTIRIPQK